MFSFFFKKPTSSDFVYDEAVILNIDFDTNAAIFLKKVEELERSITISLPEKSGIDGHEIGGGEYVLYIYGVSADNIWNSIKPIMSKLHFEKTDVTLQYGSPEDPNTKLKKFTA